MRVMRILGTCGLITECEHLDSLLYDVLVKCHTKWLFFICTCCHKTGVLAKLFMECEYKFVHAQDRQLAS